VPRRLIDLYYGLTTSLWHSGLALPGRDNGDSVSIICFHGVHSPAMAAAARPPTSSVSLESFEANVRGVLRHYEIVSLSDAIRMLRGSLPWKRKRAVLTFDDSLKSTTALALPVLERMGATATVFVSTDAIEAGAPYWWLILDYAWYRPAKGRVTIPLPGGQAESFLTADPHSLTRLKAALRRMVAAEREATVSAVLDQLNLSRSEVERRSPYAQLMSWTDLKYALKSGFSVGSHTVTHPNLTTLTPAGARYEMAASKATIEARLSIECRHFCYPYGAYNHEVAALAAANRYEAAVTTRAPGRNPRGQHLFELNRYSAPAAENKLPFAMSGAESYSQRVKVKWRQQDHIKAMPV